jgi:hypothetical protein
MLISNVFSNKLLRLFLVIAVHDAEMLQLEACELLKALNKWQLERL